MVDLKFNKKSFAEEIIKNSLDINGEVFMVEEPNGNTSTLKVINAHVDETGEIPCSSPEGECFYYCQCNHPYCPIKKLLNERKIAVLWDMEHDRMISTHGW